MFKLLNYVKHLISLIYEKNIFISCDHGGFYLKEQIVRVSFKNHLKPLILVPKILLR